MYNDCVNKKNYTATKRIYITTKVSTKNTYHNDEILCIYDNTIKLGN